MINQDLCMKLSMIYIGFMIFLFFLTTKTRFEKRDILEKGSDRFMVKLNQVSKNIRGQEILVNLTMNLRMERFTDYRPKMVLKNYDIKNDCRTSISNNRNDRN